MVTSEYKAAWYKANRERIAAAAALKYREQREALLQKAAERYAANSDRLRSAVRAQYAAMTPEQKAVVVARAAARDKANPDQARARTSLRRKRHQQATPPWLTPEHKRQIKALYVKARRLTRSTGVPHHVDHFYPLSSPTVCGWHVPWNLRVLPAKLNIEKGNRVLSDTP